MPRRLTLLAFAPFFILATSVVARAQTAEEQPAEAPAVPAAEQTVAAAETLVADPALNPPHYGGAFRARWVTVPHWVFGIFTKHNQAVSAYSLAFEGTRRKRDAENPNRFTDISLAVGFQSMHAPDGNWLGNGKNPVIDTDWVQFKNLGLWTIDLAFVQRQYFNEVFGIHYGAGLGLAIVQGKVDRTKSNACTDNNLDSCRPKVCTSTGSGCSESDLQKADTPGDNTAADPHRTKIRDIPPVLPIINLVAGFDFRIAHGLEARLEGGFYDAFFVGGAVAYIY
jgi:hypothetical protein